MKKVFNGLTVDQFRKDFQSSITELEEKYGVTINLGTLTYDETSIRGKMTALKGEREEELSKDDFIIGETVKIAHKKVLPTEKFKIIKINKVKIKVEGARGIVNVSPQLLRKLF